MSLRRDRRAAALQVGAVLLLGFLVIGLSLYQATVVPEQNKRVEFRHSQAVQNDMVEVRNAMQRAGTSEDVQSVSVDMGTTYPARVFFVNPAPPGGIIRNGTEQSATFANVSATNDETADFLNTSANGPHDLATKNLTYRPDYNVYRSAPTTAYQSGVLVNEFENANDTAVTDQALIRGKEIYLVAVRVNLSRAQVGAYAVDPESLSTATASTTIRNESGTVNVTVPTTLTEERWEQLLDDQDRVKSVSKQGGRVTILLKSGSYRLRTALVGIGTGAEAPGPAYLTTVDPKGGADVAVEVRDRFNNPVPNSRVDGNLTVNVTSGGDVLEPANVTVGEDGRAQFTYAGDTGTANLTLFEDGARALDTANNGNGSVEVEVDESDLPGDETTGTNPVNPGEGVILKDTVERTLNGDVAIVKFNNTADADRYLVEARIAFYYADSSKSNQQADSFDVNGSASIDIGAPLTSVGNVTFAADTAATEDLAVDFDPNTVKVRNDFFILTAKFKYYEDGDPIFTMIDYFVTVREQ
ncbi:MAG: hypothetical protein ABEH78_10295 [Haloferacaceae archaeon]